MNYILIRSRYELFDRVFININGNDVKEIKYKRKSINKFWIKNEDFDFVDVKEKNIRKKRLFLLIEGEEIFINRIAIKKIKIKNIKGLVNNWIRGYFKSNVDNILYDYDFINNYNNSSIEILVYCVKYPNNKLIKNYLDNNRLIKIKVYTACFINYFNKIIDEENYIVVVYFNEKIYFLAVVKNKLYADRIFNKTDTEKYNSFEIVNYLENVLSESNIKLKNIYVSNNGTSFIENAYYSNKIKSLGDVDISLLMKYCI